MSLDSYYVGTIEAVFEPKDTNNTSQYQYQYQVIITLENYATATIRAVRYDTFGTFDDFEDVILEVGARVMIKFPRGDRSMGMIMHGARQYPVRQRVELGKHWRNRFNKIVRFIDKDGNYSVTSDQGPNLAVKTDQVILDDSVGEQIILDRINKIIKLNANDYTLTIQGNVNMTVAKDSTVSITGNSNVNIKGNAIVAVTGDCSVSANNITATAKANATVNCKTLEATASGDAKITAAKISLNGEGGDILTTTTDEVVDSIFGLPTRGVKTVVAG